MAANLGIATIKGIPNDLLLKLIVYMYIDLDMV